ncbi:MAG: hypothetical protein E6I78_06295 [Chloroflexi bacterium]|nr:MAG: hypothetical protein E6I78_06295 [Chloroflexota bacterium]
MPRQIQMGISITSRLLGVVIAFALTSGIVAHAAEAPQRPLAPITLTSANALPVALQTAASHVAETATGAIDPGAAIRAAYQRDHVALEHLRQQASQLEGSAHPAFNQYISDREGALAELERTALATSRPVVASTIAAMDNLVTVAQARLNLESTKSQNSGQSDKPNDPKH